MCNQHTLSLGDQFTSQVNEMTDSPDEWEVSDIHVSAKRLAEVCNKTALNSGNTLLMIFKLQWANDSVASQ